AYNWTGSLAENQTQEITLHSGYKFTPAAPWGPYTLSAWTTNPRGTNAEANNYPDANSGNDRATVNVSPILNDAGFVDAEAMLPLDVGYQRVLLKIKNYAPKPLTSVVVNYSIDGVTQTPTYVSGINLARNQEMIVDCGTYYFGTGIRPYLIEAWTSLPNGVPDEVPDNDRGQFEVYKALSGGTYTIGPIGSDYKSVRDAMDFISYWGLAGPVTFLVRPGTYQAGITVLPRGTRQYPITFKSISGNNYDVIIEYSATSTANNFLFKFQGYNSIAFDNITFNANGTNFATIIELTGGNNNITFTNCVFNGRANAPKTADFVLIKSLNNPVTNLTLLNNVFNNGSAPLWHTSPTGVWSSNFLIKENSFGNFTWQGVHIEQTNNVQITDNNFFSLPGYEVAIYTMNATTIKNNRINGFTGNTTTALGTLVGGIIDIHTDPSAGPVEITGNSVAGSNGHGFYLQGMSNLNLQNNIVNVSLTSTGINRAGVLLTGVANSTTPAMIKNNDIKGTNLHGIFLNSNSFAKVYFNKVMISGGSKTGMEISGGSGGWIANNMIGANTATGLLINSPNTANIFYNTIVATGSLPAVNISNVGTGLNMKRNIFYNNGGGVAFQLTGTAPYNYQSNENNFFSTGANIGNVNGTLVANMTTLRNLTGKELTSANSELFFMGPTDFRLTKINPAVVYNYPLPDAAALRDEIEKFDFTNEERAKNIYYAGADNIITTITILEQPKGIVNCLGTTNQMFIVVADIDFGATLTYQWYKDGVAIDKATDPILTLPALTHEMGGVYYCDIKGTGGADDVTTERVLLYTLRTTEITTQPETQMSDLGGVVNFTLDMHIYENDPVMYQPQIQWYRGTTMLRDNDRIAGSKSSILSIRDLKPSDYGDDYWVKITGLCGEASSNKISIVELPNVVINTQPSNVSVCTGEDATFSVDAQASLPNVMVYYQWMKDGAPLKDDGRLSGAKTNTLKITNVQVQDAGKYTCKVTAQYSNKTATTNDAELMVMTQPVILTQPNETVSVKKGDELKLEITANGGQLAYQWYKDDAEIAGETNATFVKANADDPDAGVYKCKVTNPCGEVWSKEFTVAITTFIIMGAEETENGDIILYANKPNPFGEKSTISFYVPNSENVRLVITDSFGREVAVLMNNVVSAGMHNVEINATDLNLASGIYNYILYVNGTSLSKRMVIVK
ncbi:MAG: immunoglobulin domain-containing protein, partial [Candidatus Kapabacteria bacterium]|nr:immunoglobulin domain-containing protein [Candidatus Kapabacteria bacterium]